MPFQYRGDIANADIAFDANATTLDELFADAAKATMQVMVEDLSAIRQSQTVEFSLSQTDPEMLLFDFLNELIFYKDARRLVLVPTRIEVGKMQGEDGYTVKAALQGEEVDPGRHQLRTDVKAVTMLRFSVEQVTDGGWRATVVLDV